MPYSESALTNALLAHKKAWTTDAARQMRDNLKEVAAATTDAPVMVTGWHPYDMALAGDGNDGEIYDFASDGILATIVTEDFADGYEYALAFDSLTHNAGGGVGVSVEFYMAASASYVTIGTTGTFGSGVALDGIMGLPFPRLVSRAHSITEIKKGATSSATVALAAATFIGAASKADRARLSVASGSFTGGKIRMLRRREYFTG